MSNDLLSSLIKKRGILKSKLTLYDKYITSFQHIDDNRAQIIELEFRVSKIEALISDFDIVQTDIEFETDSDDDQIAEREDFENKFHRLTAQAKLLLEKLHQNDVSINNSLTNKTISCHADDLHNTILPEIKVPKFNGSYDSWLEFRDLFISLVHNNHKLGDIRKFHYLRGALVDIAPQVIQSIEFTEKNYTTAWNTLCERFNNKHLLIHNHLSAIFNMENIVGIYASKIRFLYENLFKHLTSLNQLGEPTDSWDTLLIYIISNKLDKQSAQEWEKHKFNHEQVDLTIFRDFLKKRANMLETVEIKFPKNQNSYDTRKTGTHSFQKPHYSRGENNTRSLAGKIDQNANKNSNNAYMAKQMLCHNCNGQHNLFYCPEFLKLSIKDRYSKINSLHLCVNCLRRNHTVNDCNWSGCKICGNKHNTVLHDASEKTNSAMAVSEIDISNCQNSSSENTPSLEVTNCSLATAQNSILSTAQVFVRGPSSNFLTARALLDCGSQSSFITTRLCNKLKVEKIQCKLAISGISENISYANHKCNITIMSKNSSYSFNLSCFVLDNITSDLPNSSIDIHNLNIPVDIKLADPEFFIPQPIDILIGSDAFWNLLSVGKVNLGLSYPILQNTRLGWVIAGAMSVPKTGHTSISYKTRCNLSTNISIQEQLSRFWEVEEVDGNEKSWSIEEQECENHFIQNLKTDENGRYVVSIPFKKSPNLLGDSRENAVKRFISLERRLLTNEKLRSLYIEFLNEYEQLGHMTNVSDCSRDEVEFYMPHHGVLKESSSSTKLRVVFNASAPSSSGLSLNDLQMCGPTIQQDILSIILRFRMRPIVLSSDVKMMYRQVLINPVQRSLQKIVWRKNPNESLKTYQLNTVTYGTTAASFLAIRCLHEIANECETENPLIAKIIRDDMYVDDLLTSVESEEQAKFVYTTISNILLKRGFDLRKWKSNNNNIFDTNAQCGSNFLELSMTKDHETKILGLSWECRSDILTFKIQDINPTKITKRTILSRIATIFDPLGLVSPCIIIAKILLQKLWSEKLTWDDVLPSHIKDSWLQFSSDLFLLNDLRISRYVLCDKPVYIALHGFADASETSYGACVYVVSKNIKGDINSNLLCAKSKVAPLKSLTMPKLELSASLILSRLIHKIVQSSNIKFDDIYCWSDSTIVLGWLKVTPNLLKPFVSHRVAEIQRITQNFEWRHVSTTYNPADIVSRGLNPKALIQSKLWFHGPQWLLCDTSDWPCIPFSMPELPEKRKCFILYSKITFSFDHFSELNKMKRVFTYMMRFIKNCRLKLESRKLLPYLTVEELKSSFLFLIKIAQQESFYEDYLSLQKGRTLQANSKILSLRPFIDPQGVLRVGGRLTNSDFPYDKKYPILLSPKHRLAQLVLEHEHLNLLHAGPQLLLSSVRDTFWIISGRNLARKIVRNCVKCSRYDVNNKVQPIMGDLPRARVQPVPPFMIVGVDYAGPFVMKDKPGRGCKPIKCWVSLFMCFSTRAIHLELVQSLTSDAFLQAFHRFISRRGKPSEVFSDNGTNFVKTNKDLVELSEFFKNNYSNISEYVANIGIKWHFIPANSPHFGGLWEAGVKGLKHHLRRVLGNQVLFFFDFQTLLIRIEAVLNSRPLFPLTSDPEDLSALSPSHFLIGRPMMSLIEPSVDHIKENRLSQYQLLQKLYDHFWRRWSREYISELQQRRCWKKSQGKLEKGQLVLIRDDNLPPTRWRLGRILYFNYGSDGLARVASIKTADGISSRAVNRLCPLSVVG